MSKHSKSEVDLEQIAAEFEKQVALIEKLNNQLMAKNNEINELRRRRPPSPNPPNPQPTPATLPPPTPEPPITPPDIYGLKINPDMRCLLYIVLDMNKDIKRINSCLTKEGAMEYLEKNHKNNWLVHELNNNLYITDSNNYLRFINGYCLVESEYMMKKAYYTENPTVQERGEGNTFNKWKSKMNKLNVTRDDNNAVQQITPQKHLINSKFDYLFDKITAKKLFAQQLFEPIYYHILEGKPLDNVAKASLYTYALNICYKSLVLDNVIKDPNFNLYSKANKRAIKKYFEPKLLECVKKHIQEPEDAIQIIELTINTSLSDPIGQNIQNNEHYYKKVKPIPETNVFYQQRMEKKQGRYEQYITSRPRLV